MGGMRRAVPCAQFIAFVAADHHVDTPGERSEFAGDALPGVPPHDHGIQAPLRRTRRDAREVRHFLWQAPWKTCILADTVRESCGDDERESRHGGMREGRRLV